MARSEAYDRFMKSTVIGFDQWHDGTGYDLEAFRAMTGEERAEVVGTLKARGPDQDWRAIEVFELMTALEAPKAKTRKSKSGGKRKPKGDAIAPKTDDAHAALRSSLKSTLVDTRLHAAVALRDLGDMPDFAQFLAGELGQVAPLNGLSYALNAIDGYVPEIRDALLRGARDRPEVAVHFAAKLCQLAGKTKSDFDWSMRPFFLRFGEHSPAAERAKAYQELLALIGAADPA